MEAIPKNSFASTANKVNLETSEALPHLESSSPSRSPDPSVPPERSPAAEIAEWGPPTPPPRHRRPACRRFDFSHSESALSDPPIDPPRDSCCAPLSSLRWRRLDICLRNTCNTFARAHPLVVLGELMKIAPPELKPENRPRRFLFRVAQHTGSRVHKDQDYALSLIFPDAEESLVAAFADALCCPLQNFALAHRSAVRIRTIADLTAEQPLRSETDEVCLEFTTPFQFAAADASRPWLLPASQLGALFTAQIEKLFALKLPGAPAAWDGVETLPYYWEKETIGSPVPVFRWPMAGRGQHRSSVRARAPGSDLAAVADGVGNPTGRRQDWWRSLRHPNASLGLCCGASQSADLSHSADRTGGTHGYSRGVRKCTSRSARYRRPTSPGSSPLATGSRKPPRGFRVRKENGGERLVRHASSPRLYPAQGAAGRAGAVVRPRIRTTAPARPAAPCAGYNRGEEAWQPRRSPPFSLRTLKPRGGFRLPVASGDDPGDVGRDNVRIAKCIYELLLNIRAFRQFRSAL